MRKRLAAGVAALVLFAGTAAIGGEETREERSREAPHYESPILSLLLLPVNLLIRMTEIVSPHAPKERKEPARSE